MGFVMPHVTILVGAGVMGLGLLFQIIGVATDNWVDAQGFSFGLWEVCGVDGCQDIPSEFDWLEACRAFGILAILVMAASLTCAVLFCFLSEQKILPLAAMIIAAVAAFCVLIEFAVFAGEIESAERDHLGFSFALTVVAFVLCLIAAVCFFVGRSKSSQ